MEKPLKIIGNFQSFDNENELENNERNLLNKAREVLKNAYAPYSKFKVGAALQLENGVYITGTNQENAAYPSGLCAERVAIFYASSQYPDQKIIAIAVVASTEAKKIENPISPCGSCRQSMLEYELKFESPIRFIMGSDSGKVLISPSISNLLPLAFNSKDL